MIKLKNLWKIALATMAMSAMLVACDTTSTDSEKEKDVTVSKETTPVSAKADSFTYGFKFTTEEGWACQYTSAGAVAKGQQADKVYAKLNGATAAIATEAKDKATGDGLNDDTTKIYVDSGELAPGKLYTLTYDKKNGTVKLTDAAAGAKATRTTAQESDAEGEFPAGMYISGYLGGNWAGDDNAASALLMDVVDEANEVYSFTWVAPATTITVTLKITMTEGDTTDDTIESTLYLKDVPVKTDGTTAIMGSIGSWNGGTDIVIKNEDNSAITGGIYDVVPTVANADWALVNYVNGNTDVDLASQFRMPGADDVIQLSIDAEKWVPYVKGKESIFSWTNAQGKMDAPAAK